MSADWRTQAEKDAEAFKRRMSGGSTWGTWVRKTQAPIWKRFLAWEDNKNSLWNMDCNDEVRDHLMGFFEDVYINSDYFKGNEDIFVASFKCPWKMRDLYQYMVVLYRSLRECKPVEGYRHFMLQLGYLKDESGQRFDFGFLLPEDLQHGFYLRQEDLEEWEEQAREYEEELCPF